MSQSHCWALAACVRCPSSNRSPPPPDPEELLAAALRQHQRRPRCVCLAGMLHHFQHLRPASQLPASPGSDTYAGTRSARLHGSLTPGDEVCSFSTWRVFKPVISSHTTKYSTTHPHALLLSYTHPHALLLSYTHPHALPLSYTHPHALPLSYTHPHVLPLMSYNHLHTILPYCLSLTSPLFSQPFFNVNFALNF